MKSAPWYHKYSWIVFVLVGLGGLIGTIPMVFDPAGSSTMALHGSPPPSSLIEDPASAEAYYFALRLGGLEGLGNNLITLIIALTAWRQGRRWAWIAFAIYWPFLFAFSVWMIPPGPEKYPPLVFLILVVLTLASNAGRFLRSDSALSEPVANPLS